jgi:hypothetical protein
VGGLDRRLKRVEERIPPPVDEGDALRRAMMHAIMDELGRLKSSRATGYRGGDPPIPIVPEDIPFKELGPGYTTGLMVELAIRRVFEREGIADEEIIGHWAQMFRAFSEQHGQDWEKVEDGP